MGSTFGLRGMAWSKGHCGGKVLGSTNKSSNSTKSKCKESEFCTSGEV